jgi:predicted Zn-dependent protease
MPGRALPADHRARHRPGGTLSAIPDAIDRLLALSDADACIVIVRRRASVNVRWAHNTVTTNGAADEISLSVLSVRRHRVGAVTCSSFPPERLESIVRESEAACEHAPPAPDYMPLIEDSGIPHDWDAPAAAADVGSLDAFAPVIERILRRGRVNDVPTFGYAEHGASTVWLATSSGLRRRHSDAIGRISITVKAGDPPRSCWTGQSTQDFSDVDSAELFGRLDERLSWGARRFDLPIGHYEVILEPSCTADLAITAQSFMIRRDADEGRNPFTASQGGTRIGERMFGDISMYSDPDEARIETTPFQVCASSDDVASVFDNGLPIFRTEWVRDGVLQALVTPRYWAEKADHAVPVPGARNLVVAGEGPGLEAMIRDTSRALLVTSLWYIRTVDPQTALVTGLTRDGVFLVEDGAVRGAVNNFRWNMSPVAAFAQAIQIGGSGPALAREHDDFLRAKAPPLRIGRFHMSSVSEAS